ncbi:MAG: cytochrome C oxidase subunit IV family protein [Armatimonadota bacterium]|nr:cytochrome C oxidase subunit IV family protein [Armatimonadota bacterium]MDR7402147.1 cytochrome C oxidase subunit IV family protein [Armatimonadota bacterium]MDR7404905.1 cytochrome C oxidase subunit IV family protein [Armatimonadota bacterium]MDR7436904.1 cytochrome C oxidase subunit IV family protein [Armatimonadota bacterium]MDR7472322.1 cytochrome C oxidase subunit IV family protein [Armatimonadota bacterium]
MEHSTDRLERAAHPEGYRIYGVVWFWLLVITLLELGIVLVHVPRALLIGSLLILALMKAALIIAYFMHLRYEKLSLVYAVVTPMFFLAIVLFAFIGPDALSVFYRR